MYQVAVGRLYRDNGVAKGIGERALAAGGGDAGEGGSAVGGDREAGEIAGGGASRIVVGDDHLEGVIWISRSVCLRLDNVRRGLGAGDQVDVRGAKQGRPNTLFGQSAEGSKGAEAEPPSASWQKIMMAPARKFSCLSIPIWRIWEQSNPGGTSALMDFSVSSFSSCACAENPPKPSSARKTPVRTKNRPVKTRRLKKADCEADFFFIMDFFCLCFGSATIRSQFHQAIEVTTARITNAT